MRQGFNIHSIPFLFTSLLFLSVALFAFLKNKKSRVNRSFFLFGLAAALWQFPYFIAYNLTNDVYILFWIKVAYVGLILVTPTCYHFIVSFLNLNKKNFIRIFYGFSFIFIYFLLTTDYIVSGIRKFAWGNCAFVGSYYAVFLIIWLTPSLLAIEYLYYEYKKAESPYNKKRIKYFLFTLPIAFLALIDALPNYGINIYPLGFIPLMIFGIAITYAIIRYRLLDIEIIVKKVSLIALGFAVLASILYAGSFYLQPYFSSLIGKNWILLPILLSLLAGIGMLRFINFVRQIEEDELSRKFAYRPLLKREAERISIAKNINELVAYLVRDLSSWVRLDYVGIFIFDVLDKRFSLARSIVRTKTREKGDAGLNLSLHNPLVEQLLKVKKPIIRNEIEYYLNTQTVSNGETSFLSRVVKAMAIIGAEVSIPSFCEGELLAIINIGHKLNPNEIITTEDLEIFTSLSNNIARAVYGFMLNKEKIKIG
ncbi:MAG: histidine kinase N-terminal 7TM domain-containing protein, partial [Candidatus Omnitrophota bacterium]